MLTQMSSSVEAWCHFLPPTAEPMFKAVCSILTAKNKTDPREAKMCCWCCTLADISQGLSPPLNGHIFKLESPIWKGRDALTPCTLKRSFFFNFSMCFSYFLPISLKNTNSNLITMFLAFNPVLSFPLRCFPMFYDDSGLVLVFSPVSFPYISGHSKVLVWQWPILQGTVFPVFKKKQNVFLIQLSSHNTWIAFLTSVTKSLIEAT